MGGAGEAGAGLGVAGVSERFQRSVEDVFERVGVVCATWPRLMLAGALGACAERAHALGMAHTPKLRPRT